MFGSHFCINATKYSSSKLTINMAFNLPSFHTFHIPVLRYMYEQIRERPFDFYGGGKIKKKKPGLGFAKKTRTNHKKKKTRTRPSGTQKERKVYRKIERVVIDIYNAKVHF